MKQEEKKTFPCPLCEEPLDVRMTEKKHSKPYVICEECGVQMFVRGKAGIKKFWKQVKDEDDWF